MKSHPDYKSRFRILKNGKISLVISALACSTTISMAAPTDGVVTSGSATISQNATTTNIIQSSSKASINWQNFSIASNEVVNFNQPNASSITLNRVIGNESSVINGALNANGQVWILNSNGVLFGKNASVNTAGLLATTAQLSDTDFNAGNYNFTDASTSSVINEGSIEISDSGSVILASNEVRNSGSIKAIKGDIQLVGTSEYSINLNGNSLVNLTVNKGVLDALVENSGTVIADGGEIYLTTNAVDELLKGVVNNTGIIEANSIDDLNGHVELFAHGGSVEVGGDISSLDGFVETSGKYFDFLGANIKTGEWLIDPVNITIDATLASAIVTALDNGDVTIETDTPNHADVDTSGAESGTDGNININADIITNALAAERTLTLSADNNINFADGISIDASQNSNTNELNVVLEADSDSSGSGQVILQGASGNSIVTNGGDLTINTQIDSNVAGESALLIDASTTGTVTLYDDVGENSELESLTISALSLDLGTKLHYINTLNEQIYTTAINSLATAQFANADFESGTTNWTIDTTNTIYLNGGSTIAGTLTPTDDILPITLPSVESADNSGAYDDYTSSGTFTSAISNDVDTDGGSQSLQLTYSSGNVAEGFGVVHGPTVISDNTVALQEGDGVSFKWKASGGSDAYDVFGYILNVDTGSTQVILNETGATGSASTTWGSASVTATEAGNYKFIFVAGSWDASGGRALGANLYIDNVATYSNKSFNASEVIFNKALNAGASEVAIKADKISFNDIITGTNTLILAPKSTGNDIEIGGVTNADSSVLDITADYLAKIDDADFSKVVFGDDTTGKITTKGDISIDSDLTLIGKTSGVEVANILNIGENTLTIESNSDVSDTGTGYIVSKNLSLQGSGDFILDSNDNDIDILAAGTEDSPIGSLEYVDVDDVQIGTVGDTIGLNATDTIEVTTLSSNITLSEDVLTVNQDSDAIQLNASGLLNQGSAYVGPMTIVPEPEPEATPILEEDNSDIEKVITTIANTVATSQKVVVHTPTIDIIQTPAIQQANTNLATTLGIQGANAQVVSTASADESANQVVTLQDIKTAMSESSSSGFNEDIRVPLSKNSMIDLVNGGLKLPDGVEQQFFVVADEE